MCWYYIITRASTGLSGEKSLPRYTRSWISDGVAPVSLAARTLSGSKNSPIGSFANSGGRRIKSFDLRESPKLLVSNSTMLRPGPNNTAKRSGHDRRKVEGRYVAPLVGRKYRATHPYLHTQKPGDGTLNGLTHPHLMAYLARRLSRCGDRLHRS